MQNPRCRAPLCALLVTAAFGCTVAAAQNEYEYEDEWTPTIEIAPFAGYRMGGSFEVTDIDRDIDLDDSSSYALALDFPIDSISAYELFYGRQESTLGDDSPFGLLDVDVEYLHIGGTLVVNEEPRRLIPYIMGGLGVTRFTPDSSIPNAEDDTRFSLHLGGGARLPFGDHFSLRFEGRAFLTFVDTDSAVFCASGDFGGVCRIRASSDTFFQFEVMAGAAFAF
jgi:hypothetical protein